MNIAQNVCFFAKDIFSITSRYFVSIEFDPFSHILLWKNHEKAYFMP